MWAPKHDAPNDSPIAWYDRRIKELNYHPLIIPLEVPMTRHAIQERLYRAAVAEVRDPDPEDLLA